MNYVLKHLKKEVKERDYNLNKSISEFWDIVWVEGKLNNRQIKYIKKQREIINQMNTAIAILSEI